VSRALRALSSTYVERRGKLAEGAALSGAGKRAAFALFYGPLHFLLIRHVTQNLPGASAPVPTLIDLGCGTGAAGAAWADTICRVSDTVCASTQVSDTSTGRVKVAVVGIDRHPWAVTEAAATYRAFGLKATERRADIATATLPKSPAAILAAFTLNELGDEARDALLARLVERASAGDRVLIVEPVAGFVARWWNRWRAAFESAGGRADEWRVRVELPPIVAKLDRAAGLNHREITGRSLWLGKSG
jgi:precorrin-6B methylase 2